MPSSKPFNKNKHKKSNFIIRLERVIGWLSQAFGSRLPWPVEVFTPLLQKLDLVLSTRGPLELIRYVKATRGQLLNYLSGSRERVSGVKCTHDGLPCSLGDLVPLIRQTEMPGEILPFLWTILMSTRSLKCGQDLDLTPIVGPSSSEGKDMTEFAKSF